MGWRRLLLIAAVVVMGIGALVRVAMAQVPPHYPGTICFTPTFWCWAQPPGPPGAACWCYGPFGAAQGVLN